MNVRHRLSLALALVAPLMTIAGASVPDGTASAAVGFEALASPQRLLDTRIGGATADGAFAGIDVRPAGSTLVLDVAGRAGIAATASTAVLNVTVDAARDGGYVTAFPCGDTRPNSSNLNYAAGQTIANTVVTTLDSNGRVCLYTYGATHLIVDAAGTLAPDSFSALAAPQRLLDTRPSATTADGAFAGIGARSAGSTLTLGVAGRAGVPAGASAVVLSVTVDAARGDGYVTVYPCDEPRPNSSNLNYATGQTIPNAVVTKLAADGTVCLFTYAATDLLVDVAGVFPADAFAPLPAPQRVLDSRIGGGTADGLFAGAGRQPGGTTLQVPVAGRVGVPSNASAVVLNVTAVGAAGGGYVTTHPQGTQRPNASNVNYVAGQTIPNLVIARVGAGGGVCLFTSATTDLLVDVAGWLAGPPPPTSGPVCPSATPTHSTTEMTNRLVVRPALHRAVGHDSIAVWVCEHPEGTVTVDADDVAAWAQAEVAPYFAEVSGGRYTMTFTALGRLPMPPMRADLRATTCANAAADATGAPYTNVLVTDNDAYPGGVASPGWISGDPSGDAGAMAGAPNVSRRFAWVGGGATGVDYKSPAVVVHELGHTIHWPHSYLRNSNRWEYDNPVDVMSGEPLDGCDTSSGFLACPAQHTLAFNRLAAGWIEGGQAAIHPSGSVIYTLDAPAGGGIQLVALPDPFDGRSMLTLAARPAVGRDVHLGKEGVAVHVVDQVPRGDGNLGISAWRRQLQALGSPDSYEHVVGVGESVTVHGATINVLARSGDRFVVQVSGSYLMPASNYFTEAAGVLPCASLDVTAALGRGCVR